MLTLVAGRPGEGKSLFAAYLTVEISKKNVVLFSNMEDPLAHVVRPRLEAANTNLKNVQFVNLRFPADLEKLEGLAQEHKPKLVLIDPISAHLRVSIYNDQDVRTVLSPLTALAAKYGFAVVAIHHTVKNAPGTGHPLRAIGGSGGGLPGAARAVYVFGINPSDADERILAPVKFNLGPPPRSCRFEMDDHEFSIGKGADAELIHTGRLLYITGRSRVTATQLLMSGSPDSFPARSPRPSGNGPRVHHPVPGSWPRPADDLREDGTRTDQLVHDAPVGRRNRRHPCRRWRPGSYSECGAAGQPPGADRRPMRRLPPRRQRPRPHRACVKPSATAASELGPCHLPPQDEVFFRCEVCRTPLCRCRGPAHMETHIGREVMVPDVAGEILGWRAWKVEWDVTSQSYELHSATRGYTWPKNSWAYAHCAARGHAPPGEKCSCGMYAAKTREQLLDMSYHVYDTNDVVVGEVAMAGKVIPGTQGWRAERRGIEAVRALHPLGAGRTAGRCLRSSGGAGQHTATGRRR
jgi:hypothetical protein